MKMDRRLTNGLAWAGALLVIGIPAADYISGAFAGGAGPSIAVVDATPTAPATATPPAAAKPAPAVEKAAEAPKPAPVPETTPQAVAGSSDPVDGFLQSGRELPSYITGGGAPAATKPTQPTTRPQIATPAPTAPTPTQTATTPPAAQPPMTQPNQQVAALPPKVAPIPMPLSMRPQPVTVPLASNQQPLIIDRPTVPPAALPTQQQQQGDFVSSEDLQDWESGPLSEFLARRNQQSSATYQVQQNQPAYDGNGFWLDEGPRNNRPSQRYPQRDDDVYYVPF